MGEGTETEGGMIMGQMICRLTGRPLGTLVYLRAERSLSVSYSYMIVLSAAFPSGNKGIIMIHFTFFFVIKIWITFRFGE